MARFFSDLLNGLVPSLMGTPLGFKAERVTVDETTLLNKIQEDCVKATALLWGGRGAIIKKAPAGGRALLPALGRVHSFRR
jgi:hypothetical protein